MLKQGIHPKIVQERLVHNSIQITLDAYSKVIPGLQQAAANRFDDIVNGQTNTTRRKKFSSKLFLLSVGRAGLEPATP